MKILFSDPQSKDSTEYVITSNPIADQPLLRWTFIVFPCTVNPSLHTHARAVLLLILAFEIFTKTNDCHAIRTRISYYVLRIISSGGIRASGFSFFVFNSFHSFCVYYVCIDNNADSVTIWAKIWFSYQVLRTENWEKINLKKSQKSRLHIETPGLVSEKRRFVDRVYRLNSAWKIIKNKCEKVCSEKCHEIVAWVRERSWFLKRLFVFANNRG